MKWPRASGLLAAAPPFPAPFGIGELGAPTLCFLDYLTPARQSLWQVLPLGPTGYGNSPYASLSAFAGNPLLISPERLGEEGLLPASARTSVPNFPTDRVDYGGVITWKMGLLRRSPEHFRTHSYAALRKDYEEFCDAQATGLDEV